MDVVVLNSSGRPQLEDALAYYRESRADKGQVQVGAMLCQEHHVVGDAWADLQHRCCKGGWQMQGARGVRSSGGRDTVGVGIAVRSGIGLGRAADLGFDCSPRESPGRLAVGWVDGVLRGGVMMISIYLWHSEGLSERNVALLHAAGEAIASFGGPWMMGGDWNMEPEELMRAQGWLARVGGTIRAPEAPTCRSALGGRVIDYVVLDMRIAGAVQCIFADLAFPASPHTAVVVRMRCTATRDLARLLVRPRAFPSDRPVGCAREPTQPEAAIMQRLAEATRSCPQGVGSAFEHLMQLAESEWCGACDQVSESGGANPRYRGRGAPAKYVWGPAVPRAAGSCGRSDGITLGLSWVEKRLAEQAGILGSLALGAACTPAMAGQWAALGKSLRNPVGPAARLLEEERDKWQWRLLAAGCLSMADTYAADSLRRWAAEARAQAAQRGSAAARDARRGWRRWVDEQLRLGAGALHRLSKREDIVAATVVEGRFGPSLGLQQVLESDRETWRAVWERFADTAGAPWRDALELPPWAPELPAITPADIVAVSKTYRRRTGLGCDSLHPRWLGWLSEPVLQGLAELLMTLERVGVWPGQVQTILVAQIPKSDGGRRPIGLLAGIVRVWERIRKPLVAAWRCTVEREYNWAAKGRSAQAAVWKQALQAEAATARGEHSAATLVDLVKAFEMVKLEIVWRRGLQLHFPPQILRLTLESFAFVRRLMLSGAVADGVSTLSAVLAGGGFATDALFIVLVRPCDELLVEPSVGNLSICLFVDDLTLHVTGSEREVAEGLAAAVDRCIGKMEGELEMTVSRGRVPWRLDSRAKTIAIASSRGLARALEPKMRAYGVATKRKAKLLGVDFSCGKRVVRSVQRGRIAKVCARLHRFRRLGRRAASRLLRTGAAPALRYGAGVCGVPDTSIRAVRRFSCAVQGEMRGRSTFARLQLASFDIGASMAVDPIVEWARAVWDGLACPEDMRAAWRYAVRTVGLSSRPFQQVIGPPGADGRLC